MGESEHMVCMFEIFLRVCLDSMGRVFTLGIQRLGSGGSTGTCLCLDLWCDRMVWCGMVVGLGAVVCPRGVLCYGYVMY